MACSDGILANIVSNCTSSRAGGLEVVAWAFNRLDLSITFDGTTENKITALANVNTAKGYKLTGVRKLLNAGADAVIADDRPKLFSHFFSFQQFETLAEDIENVDNMNDVVIIVERKDKTSTVEGTFLVLGAKKGLYKSADTKRENDANGARKLELKSMAGQEEQYSQYTLKLTGKTYTQTIDVLDALLISGGA